MAISFGATIQLGTNVIIFFILIASSIPDCKDSISSFLVPLVQFWFHSAMDISYLHIYDGFPLGELSNVFLSRECGTLSLY